MIIQLMALVIVLPGENFVTVSALESCFQMNTFNMPFKVISGCQGFNTMTALKSWRCFFIILIEMVDEQLADSVLLQQMLSQGIM